MEPAAWGENSSEVVFLRHWIGMAPGEAPHVSINWQKLESGPTASHWEHRQLGEKEHGSCSGHCGHLQ